MKPLICRPNDIRLTEFLQETMLMDKFIHIKIHRDQRTNKQNKYMHAIFAQYGDYVGLTMRETKEFFRDLFLGYEKVDNFGVVHRMKKSTTELNTKEMTDFIEAIRKYCAENGIDILSPDEYFNNQAEFYNQYGI